MDGPIGAADDIFSSLNSDLAGTQQNLGDFSGIFFSSDDEDDLQNNVTTTTETPTVFDRFFDSSSEDELYSSASGCSGGDNDFLVQTAGKRLDYMIQYLDRKLSTMDVNEKEGDLALPEVIASGGGGGIFKLPIRAAVDPGRPPSLELRPTPFRETQIGCSVRVLEGAVNGGLLWGGSERVVSVWDMKDMFAAGRGEGDEGVPCYESMRTSPTFCLVVDDANMVVWSGHKDGKIRCWKMSLSLDAYEAPFQERFSWQAHDGPVLSMAISTFGDVWSGSEGGAIVVWPWEAIGKALSCTREERHMAALIVERSCIDLKNQVTMIGVSCSVLAADVKYMLCDHSGAKMWTVGYLSFGLWDASTRELLKVFNIDGQAETLSVIQDVTKEDTNFVSVPKKEKVQSSFSFFQHSRDAIMGAADAVRRVAAKGVFGEDNRRIEALIITNDGVIWTGLANGLLVCWDRNGNRLQEFQYHSYAITCLFTFGLQIWVGYATGNLIVLDLDGNLLGKWVAHSSPVIDIALGAGYVFTLANDGGIRAWSTLSPGQLDGVLGSELAGKEFLYTKLEKLRILAGTWNVAQGRATYSSLISWLGSESANVDVIAVGMQEVEMGAGFLAMSAARETMQVGLDVSSAGQWWLDMIGKTFNEGSTFQRVGSRQLAGLVIAVWIRNDIRAYVGDVDVSAVPCGFGNAIGNKGAVGVKMRIYGRIMCFVNCHFAAHQEAVNRRNADFDHVYRTMFAISSAAGVTSSNQMPRVANVDSLPELSKADMVVFLGDFNYRLNSVSYDEARDIISRRNFEWLIEKDQLRTQMKAGCVFQGMREAVITFPPTYKFERHRTGLAAYDSGEKKRIPAWCDRILYRDNRPASSFTCNLNCPVVASILRYEACMDVTDSDHKPVRCLFSVELARLDESMRRQEFGETIRSNDKIRHLLKEQCYVPETVLSTYNIVLHDHQKSFFHVTNKSGKDKALLRVLCEGECVFEVGKQPSSHCPRGSFGFPRWLEVKPMVGIVSANQSVEISVRHKGMEASDDFIDGFPNNHRHDDSMDKEVVLVVEVRGSRSTERICHRIYVRNPHSFSDKSNPMNRSHVNANIRQKSNFVWPSNSSDGVDNLDELHNPWRL